MSLELQDAPWTLLGQSGPFSSLIVRIISIMSLIIGIVSLLPLIVFVLMDITLYTWRLYCSLLPSRRQNTSAQSPHSSSASAPAHIIHGTGASTTLVDAVGQSSLRPR